MACAASMTALSPEEHTLLMVVQGVVGGRPAPREAWVAGACGAGGDTWQEAREVRGSTAACWVAAQRTWPHRCLRQAQDRWRTRGTGGVRHVARTHTIRPLNTRDTAPASHGTQLNIIFLQLSLQQRISTVPRLLGPIKCYSSQALAVQYKSVRS